MIHTYPSWNSRVEVMKAVVSDVLGGLEAVFADSEVLLESTGLAWHRRSTECCRCLSLWLLVLRRRLWSRGRRWGGSWCFWQCRGPFPNCFEVRWVGSHEDLSRLWSRGCQRFWRLIRDCCWCAWTVQRTSQRSNGWLLFLFLYNHIYTKVP